MIGEVIERLKLDEHDQVKVANVKHFRHTVFIQRKDLIILQFKIFHGVQYHR